MQYSVENELLRLTVDTHGAEAVSVIHKPTGAELLWQADPAVWGRHAPILFPYTGKLTGGKMIAKGMEYAGSQHGRPPTPWCLSCKPTPKPCPNGPTPLCCAAPLRWTAKPYTTP